MKILHITPSYIPAYRHGGPVVSVHELNKWLVKLGVDVTVYTTDIDGDERLRVPLNQEIDVDGVKVFYFPLSFRPWEYSFAMHRAIKKNVKNFDCIHITSVFLSASALGAWYARKYKKPYIISPRGNFMRQTYENRSFKKKIYTSIIESRILGSASTIHFTSERERSDYMNMRLPIKRSFVLPNPFRDYVKSEDGVITFRKKWNIGEQGLVVLSLGRLHWIKGFDTLIPAFAKVVEKFPETKLLIAGPDEDGYEAKIKFQISNLKIDKNVIFTGMLMGKEKEAAYRVSDIFVAPSYSESFGMSIIEAMYESIPVVITEGVAIADEIKAANAGVVIKKDERELEGALVGLIQDGKKAKELGARGELFARKNFSGELVAGKFIKEYNEIVER